MDKINKKNNQSSTIILISILVIAAVAYFFINSYISQIKDLNIKLSARSDEITQMQSKIDALNSLKNDFSQNSDKAKKLGLALPSGDQIPEVLVQLETIANSSGLKVSSIMPAKENAKNALSLSLSLQGEYPGLVSFISSLEKNIRPVNIKTINLASVTKENQSSLNFTLGLELLKSGVPK